MKRRLLLLLPVVLALWPIDALAASYAVIKPTVKQGMLVSLSANSGVVEPTSPSNASALAGVVVANTSQTSTGQVEVANDGQAQVLVSTLNGAVKVGDRIAPTALEGLGAKLHGTGWIVGTAQGSFDTTSKNAVATEVSDTTGAKHRVYVGRVPVAIHVTYFNDQTTPVNSVQALADKIAGQHASVLGILLSFVLLFVGLVIVGMVITTTIKGSFAAVSRQPLIRRFVVKSVFQSFLIAGAVMIAVFTAAYLLLRFV